MRRKHDSEQRHVTRRITPANVEAELSRLSSLDIAELRSIWVDRFGPEVPPVRSGDVLMRMLAWHLQAEAYGGLEQETIRQLRRIGKALERDGTYEPQIRRDIAPGVVLTREWKGVTHKVTVTADGFMHRGGTYRSLSDVARTITGTRWSGPRFFGLEQKPTRPSGATTP